MSTSKVQWHKSEQQLLLLVLCMPKGVLGAFCQEGPLMWLHQSHTDLYILTSKFDQTFQLGLKMMFAQRTYRKEPYKLVFPFPLRIPRHYWKTPYHFSRWSLVLQK